MSQQFELDTIPYQNAVTLLCFYRVSNELPFVFLSIPVHASTLFHKYAVYIPTHCTSPQFPPHYKACKGRVSPVGRATRHKLDSPAFEHR